VQGFKIGFSSIVSRLLKFRIIFTRGIHGQRKALLDLRIEGDPAMSDRRSQLMWICGLVLRNPTSSASTVELHWATYARRFMDTVVFDVRTYVFI
jgi:hypothetical protein